MTVQLQVQAQTATGLTLGIAGFTHAQASSREIIETIVIPSNTEVSFATQMTDARLLYVENQATETDNYVSVGLATGVYLMDVYPGQQYIFPFTGKPDDPTLFFLFQNVVGGSVRIGMWD